MSLREVSYIMIMFALVSAALFGMVWVRASLPRCWETGVTICEPEPDGGPRTVCTAQKACNYDAGVPQ